jgi:hypothetical protein
VQAQNLRTTDIKIKKYTQYFFKKLSNNYGSRDSLVGIRGVVWGGGGWWCSGPQRQSPKGGKMDSKIYILNLKNLIFRVQQIFHYWAKYNEIQQIIVIF